MLPMVTEVNAVSEELNKYRSFELVLMSGVQQDEKDRTTKVMVKVRNLLNNNVWMWERGKFMNRRYMIQELYQQYLDGDEAYKRTEDNDPFYDPPEDVIVGTANVFLQSLSYALDFEDKLAITDYKGQEEGSLDVCVTPCTADGKPLDEDSFVEEPQELLNKPYHFKVHVRHSEIHNSAHIHGVYVKYKTIGDEEFISTNLVKASLSPSFDHSRIVTIPSINQEHLDFFESGSITFWVYACQTTNPTEPSAKKLTTRELRERDGQMSVDPGQRGRRGTIAPGRRGSVSVHDGHMKAELSTLQKKYERLEQKEKRMQQLCTDWEAKPDEGKDFEAFMRAVKAVAFSSGGKFKSRVRLVGQIAAAGNSLDSSPKNKGAKSPSPSKGGKEKSSVCTVM